MDHLATLALGDNSAADMATRMTAAWRLACQLAAARRRQAARYMFLSPPSGKKSQPVWTSSNVTGNNGSSSGKKNSGGDGGDMDGDVMFIAVTAQHGGGSSCGVKTAYLADGLASVTAKIAARFLPS